MWSVLVRFHRLSQCPIVLLLSDIGTGRITSTHRKEHTMARSTAQRLADYQRRYRNLAAQLADIGYIAAGSLAQRHNRCGKPNCRCHGDPPQLHGPYWQWPAKVNGKTVNRRLTQREAELSQDWIANDRRHRAPVRQPHQRARHITLDHDPCDAGQGMHGESLGEQRTQKVHLAWEVVEE